MNYFNILVSNGNSNSAKLSCPIPNFPKVSFVIVFDENPLLLFYYFLVSFRCVDFVALFQKLNSSKRLQHFNQFALFVIEKCWLFCNRTFDVRSKLLTSTSSDVTELLLVIFSRDMLPMMDDDSFRQIVNKVERNISICFSYVFEPI